MKKLLLVFGLLAALVPPFLYHLDSHVLSERQRMMLRHTALFEEAKRVTILPGDETSLAELERLEGEITAIAAAYNALPALLLRNGDDLPPSLPDVRTRRGTRPPP